MQRKEYEIIKSCSTLIEKIQGVMYLCWVFFSLIHGIKIDPTGAFSKKTKNQVIRSTLLGTFIIFGSVSLGGKRRRWAERTIFYILEIPGAVYVQCRPLSLCVHLHWGGDRKPEAGGGGVSLDGRLRFHVHERKS